MSNSIGINCDSSRVLQFQSIIIMMHILCSALQVSPLFCKTTTDYVGTRLQRSSLRFGTVPLGVNSKTMKILLCVCVHTDKDNVIMHAFEMS